MTAALRGSVRAQWRTSRVPTAVDGARPRPARNSAATPSYPLDRSIISGLFQFLEPNGSRLSCKRLLAGRKEPCSVQRRSTAQRTNERFPPAALGSFKRWLGGAASHAAVDQPDRPRNACADRPISGSPRRRSASGSRREGWALEHARPVLDELDAAVEGAVVDHIERDVGIAVVDAFRAGGTGDHGKDDHPETVYKTRLEQRPAQADAAERAKDAGALLLHRPDRLHGVAAHEGRVGPR